MKNSFRQLGKKTQWHFDKPDSGLLESFENRHTGQNYLIPIDCREFTCLCPVTGQPDFARLKIVYVPEKKCVESKSLKLYLGSFRNYGIFHESVANQVFEDLWNLLKPKFLRVRADFSLRGGIAIQPMVQKFAANLKKKEQEEIREML